MNLFTRTTSASVCCQCLLEHFYFWLFAHVLLGKKQIEKPTDRQTDKQTDKQPTRHWFNFCSGTVEHKQTHRQAAQWMCVTGCCSVFEVAIVVVVISDVCNIHTLLLWHRKRYLNSGCWFHFVFFFIFISINICTYVLVNIKIFVFSVWCVLLQFTQIAHTNVSKFVAPN